MGGWVHVCMRGQGATLRGPRRAPRYAILRSESVKDFTYEFLNVRFLAGLFFYQRS